MKVATLTYRELRKCPIPAISHQPTHFVEIPYSELLRFYQDAIKDPSGAADRVGYNKPSKSRLARLVRGWQTDSHFYGGTVDDMLSYLDNGYRVGQLDGSFLPGVLRTRDGDAMRGRWLWSDHGDEIDVGLALSGDPDCFRIFDQAPTLGGMNVVAMFAFTAGTDFNIIAQFGAWIAQLLGTCQAAGISPALSIDQYGMNVSTGGGLSLVRTRVKSEHDALDWRRYSALFSPTGFRHLGFAGLSLATGPKHLIPGTTEDGLGQPRSPSTDWDLDWDSATRTLTAWGPTTPRTFDPSRMTQRLIETGALTPNPEEVLV